MEAPGFSRTALATLALPLLVASCGPVSRRDLSGIPQRQITFDDMCHLQEYFDARRAANARPFRVEEEQSTETQAMEPDENGRMQRVMIGEGTYVVRDRAARRRLAQLLGDEYDRLPSLRLTGREAGESGVRVRVGWWSSGQVRRLRPDREIVIRVGSESMSLPFNPCVGEFLFGAEPYAIRRRVLDAEAARARGELPTVPVPSNPSESASEPSPPAASSSSGGASETSPPAASSNPSSSPLDAAGR